jgi:uroporphyrinogen-III synthase
MHLLVTRPEAETRVLRERLEAAGHTVTVEPLLEVELLPPVSLRGAFSSIQALIVTSRNGVRALVQAPDTRDVRSISLFAVGPGTAAAAREAGFARVKAGPGAGRELAPIVAAACDPAAGTLLYLTGETVAYDLEADLSARGFCVRRAVVYRSRPRQHLSPATLAAIRSGTIGGVLLMSPSSAEAWVQTLDRHQLHGAIKNIVHFCISANVAARLTPLGTVPAVIAVQPNLEEMLALVATLAAQSRTKA